MNAAINALLSHRLKLYFLKLLKILSNPFSIMFLPGFLGTPGQCTFLPENVWEYLTLPLDGLSATVCKSVTMVQTKKGVLNVNLNAMQEMFSGPQVWMSVLIHFRRQGD